MDIHYCYKAEKSTENKLDWYKYTYSLEKNIPEKS